MEKPVIFVGNNTREIGKAETREQAINIINKFLEEHNYTSYYMRIWSENGVMWFDVGSHTEFFTWG